MVDHPASRNRQEQHRYEEAQPACKAPPESFIGESFRCPRHGAEPRRCPCQGRKRTANSYRAGAWRHELGGGIGRSGTFSVPSRAWNGRLARRSLLKSDLILLASETILLKSDLILLPSECFLLKSDLILLASEAILLKSDLILLASECFLLESGLILLRSDRLRLQSERVLLRSEGLLLPSQGCPLGPAHWHGTCLRSLTDPPGVLEG